jgi:hypothetical protein
MNSLGKEYLDSVISRVKEGKSQGDRTFDQLEEKDFHFQPSSASNSLAVIIQHMSGNMLSRWTNFLTEDGEKDWRQRDDEFEEHVNSKQELLAIWEKGWNCFLQALESLSENDLLKTVHIRKAPLTVIDAINRQMAHYSLHIGQILYIGKLIKNENWKSLSIPKGHSRDYNPGIEVKDPVKKSS